MLAYQIKIMKLNLLSFFLERWVNITKFTTSFVDKRVLVTDINIDIDFEVAATLIFLDVKYIILVVHNINKDMKVHRKIKTRKQEKLNVHVWKLDMRDYLSMQRFAAWIKMKMSRLNVVILNTDISFNDYVIDVEDWESIL